MYLTSIVSSNQPIAFSRRKANCSINVYLSDMQSLKHRIGGEERENTTSYTHSLSDYIIIHHVEGA